ncbi:hypothetical protein JOD45_000289 [Scopulibacillus daqui]|uniref:Uncharacterized protein n=1 Tax=Scopulibacillus daqui TaxID=1469162 RepID=A0ABS2PVK9_9BACL|nr:hypothetical protein [Scopulibacillus daqui]MBM7644098.1 hypothetical protein [Scopulibacillus daqui]
MENGLTDAEKEILLKIYEEKMLIEDILERYPLNYTQRDFIFKQLVSIYKKGWIDGTQCLIKNKK